MSGDTISTGLIHKAITYYSDMGYRPIDVPYIVSLESWAATCPCPDRRVDDGEVYVGSAEQSFIELHHRGQLEVGNYQALTPCVRFDYYDNLHRHVFLKLELIEVGKSDYTSALQCCQDFFRTFAFGGREVVEVIESECGHDLVALTSGGAIELGSYGTRFMRDGVTPYVFATGVAEPRTSYVQSLIGGI